MNLADRGGFYDPWKTVHINDLVVKALVSAKFDVFDLDDSFYNYSRKISPLEI